jgi:hypothetical protein
MRTKKQQPHVIRDVKAIRLLGSPLRQAILDWIAASGAATVAELSEHLRRPADRLYYHVRLLERAGLLVGHESAAPSGRAEMRFDVPGRPMLLQYEPSNRRAVKTVIAGVLRSARSDFNTSLADSAVRVDGPARELWAGRIEALLTPDDVERLNAAIGQVFAALGQSSSRATDAKVYQFTWVMSPVTR